MERRPKLHRARNRPWPPCPRRFGIGNVLRPISLGVAGQRLEAAVGTIFVGVIDLGQQVRDDGWGDDFIHRR
jgi:hypothetical protein